MGKIARIALMCAVCCAAQVCIADNTLFWGTTDPGQFRVHDNSTYLTPGANENVGYLVQLIYAGGNGVADVVDINDNPADDDNFWTTSGDDVFAAYAWIGRNMLPFSPYWDGTFSGPDYVNSRPNGSVYFIRAWEYVSDTPGDINIQLGDYYGNSALFTVSGYSTPNPPYFADESFLVNGTVLTTSQVMPEPGTLALFGVGAVLAAIRRRLK